MHTGPAQRFGVDVHDSGVRITSDDDGAVLQVAVHGQWDWRLTLAVRTAVNKCLAEHPTAVIVNLGAADDPSGFSALVLVVAHRVGRAMQPPVPIAVCVAPGSHLESRLRTMGAAWFLPLFSEVPSARTALAHDLALPDHLQLDLRPLPQSCERARRLVAEAGHGWALPQLVHPAELIMSELATNAVQHAGTDLLVTVSRRRTSLYLTVRDGSTVLPPLPGKPDAANGTQLHEHGYGLWMVDQVAAAWGAHLTHQRTGKVVWAVVRHRPPGRRAGSSPPPTLESAR
jgi:anti-sigma regulatory factor (Ser/Thr protein kinase)